ncbi:MAG: hypothetical protein ACON4E_07400 [Flavobacteriales bacterium]
MPSIFRIIYFLKRLIRPFLNPKVIHFIGDSHVDVFWHMEHSPLYFWRIIPKIKIVHGATATGLANPNSKTKAFNEFINYSKKIRPDDYIVVQLGEVDCGFAIWYRAEKHGISVEEQTDLAVNNYSSIMDCFYEISGEKCYVSSAVLPTIKDNQEFGEVANLRREVKASIKERTSLSLLFNKKIKAKTKEKGVGFIDLDLFLLDKKTNIIKDLFIHPDLTDHHLDPVPFSIILNKCINRIVKG